MRVRLLSRVLHKFPSEEYRRFMFMWCTFLSYWIWERHGLEEPIEWEGTGGITPLTSFMLRVHDRFFHKEDVHLYIGWKPMVLEHFEAQPRVFGYYDPIRTFLYGYAAELKGLASPILVPHYTDEQFWCMNFGSLISHEILHSTLHLAGLPAKIWWHRVDEQFTDVEFYDGEYQLVEKPNLKKPNWLYVVQGGKYS